MLNRKEGIDPAGERIHTMSKKFEIGSAYDSRNFRKIGFWKKPD
jgi:hypothetical protein